MESQDQKPVAASAAGFGTGSLVLFQKMEDFTGWLFPILDRFPRTEKLSLVSHMKNVTLEILTLIIKTNKSANRRPGWYEVDVQVELLRFLLRHARARKYLAPKSYETAARSLAEVGRLIGGLLRGARC